MTITSEAGATAPAAGRRVTPTGRLIFSADAEIERRDAAIAEALRLLESAPEAFLGASQNVGAAVHVLRQVHEGEAARD